MNSNDRKDLILHHRVLKQFLDISDDSSANIRGNSTRATKAREKLLKLSTAQFGELSTDVYDELQRRIDESRGEPDFLLPKSSFHPKRNQARQKLSSLPASRFKDLVTDILFEIERRNLHVKTESEASTTRQSGSTVASSSPTNVRKASLDQTSTRQLSPEKLPSTIGVQPTTVIPTKANLTWSSDEEEDEPAVVVPTREILPESELQDVPEGSIPSYSPDKHYRNSIISNGESAKNSPQHQRGLSNGIGKDREIEMLLKESTKMDEKITHLEKTIADLTQERDGLRQANENSLNLLNDFHSKNMEWDQHKRSLETKISSMEKEGSRSVNSILNPEIDHLKSVNASLLSQLESLKQSNGDSRALPVNQTIPHSSLINDGSLKNELQQFESRLSSIKGGEKEASTSNDSNAASVIQWQKRFQEARSKHLSLSYGEAGLTASNISNFLDSNGLISLNLVSDLQAAIESFTLYLSEENVDSDVLFENISGIAVIANEIAGQGDRGIGATEYTSLIRATLSHAITATRYYAIYRAILPRLVMEAAIHEVEFAVCDLISVCKIKPDSHTTIANSTAERQQQQQTLALQSVSDSVGGIRSMNGSSEKLDRGDMSGVRPLKMANRLRSSNNNSGENLAERGGLEEPFRAMKGINIGSPVTNDFPRGNVFTTPERLSNGLNVIPQASKAISQEEPEVNDIPRVSAPVKDNGNGFAAMGFASVLATENLKENPEQTKKATPTKSNGVASLASRFSQTPEQVKESSPRSFGGSSNGGTPPKGRNILDKLKQFESPTQETFPLNKISPGRIPASLNSDIVQKFGSTRKPSGTQENGSNDAIGKEIPNPASLTAFSNSVGSNGALSKEIPVPAIISSLSNGSNNEASKKVTFGEVLPDDKEDFTNGDAKQADKGKSNGISPLNVIKRSISKVMAGKKSAPSTAATPPTAVSTTSEKEIKPNAAPVTNERDLTRERSQTGSSTIASTDSDHTFVPSSRELEDKNYAYGFSIDPTEVKKSIEVKMPTEVKKPAEVINAEWNKPIEVETPAEVKKELTPSNVVPSKTANINYYTSESEDDEFEDSRKNAPQHDNSETSPSSSEEEQETRRKQELRKSMAATTFNIDLFDIDDPDNTLTQLLLYLEHQTVQVISTIQTLLSSIKRPDSTKGNLRDGSNAISEVISQMTEATNNSMNQTRNKQLKDHGSWVVKNLADCDHRMGVLCNNNDSNEDDEDYADKNFKQRLAGIAFDIAKCTKELVKTVEEASIKEEIAHLDARINRSNDLM